MLKALKRGVGEGAGGFAWCGSRARFQRRQRFHGSSPVD